MNGLAKFIVKFKYIILGVFILILIASFIALFYVKVNSDIISYLPDDMTTTEGYKFLKETFDMDGDAIVAVDGVKYEKMVEYVAEITKLKGIKPNGVVWYGMFDNFGESIIGGADIINEIKNNPNVIKMFMPKGIDADCYTVMMQLNVPTSSPEAMNIVTSIDKMFKNDNVEHAFGGSTAIATDILTSTMSEMGMYMIVAMLLVIIILLLTTPSFFEPIILLITLGLSVLINIGTNIIFPNVSIITFAASSILQIALSMDYAIFLMHAYAEERKSCFDNGEAMRRAIPKTFSTITASALTTVGGFLALFFMEFKIGADLGLVLAKGVFLSLLTVIFLQPCLILTFTKVLDKSKHKVVLPSFKKVAGTSIKYKKWILLASMVILIPALIGGTSIGYSYINMDKDGVEYSEMDKIVAVMGNSVILCVPKATAKTQLEYIHKIEKVDKVVAVSGLYSIMPEKYSALIEIMVNRDMPELKSYVNNGYTLYSIMIDVDSESDGAGVVLKDIRGVTHNYFNEDYYITGVTQAVSDLAEITPRDFTVVTIASILIILIVLLFTLRSLKLSAALIAVVELGIFINIALSYFMGDKINFMAYIIISSIQLGATIDYAILYTVKFKRNLLSMGVKESSYKALKDAGPSILTSAAIIAGVCFAVFFISSNRIVAEITMLIGRGAIISCILVFFLLPAILTSLVKTSTRKKMLGFKKKEKVKKLEEKND